MGMDRNRNGETPWQPAAAAGRPAGQAKAALGKQHTNGQSCLPGRAGRLDNDGVLAGHKAAGGGGGSHGSARLLSLGNHLRRCSPARSFVIKLIYSGVRSWRLQQVRLRTAGRPAD